MKLMAVKKFTLEAISTVLDEWARDLNRTSIRMNTKTYLYKSVSKIKNVEVSGDTIAELTRWRIK